MTNKIKRLSLHFWMELDPEDCHAVAVNRELIGKPGVYYDRQTKECWFEVNGVGYTNKYLAQQFLYDLSILNIVPLNSEQEKQIRALLNTLPKAQSATIKNLRMTLNMDSQAKCLRNVSRDSKKMMLRFSKEHGIKDDQ